MKFLTAKKGPLSHKDILVISGIIRKHNSMMINQFLYEANLVRKKKKERRMKESSRDSEKKCMVLHKQNHVF